MKYKVINTAPVLTIDKTSVSLNPAMGDNQSISFNLTGKVTDYTNVSVKLLDSKNKEVSGNLTVKSSYSIGSSRGTVLISTDSTTPMGQTYKLKITPNNYQNHKEGTSKFVTIKTVAQSSSTKTGVTVKAAGGIDVNNPRKNLTLTFTGKNINMYGKELAFIDITDKNGTSVAEYFDVSVDKYSSDRGILPITQNLADSSYPLIGSGLEGQTVTIKAGFKLGGGEELTNVTCKAKIAATKITPKLAFTKVSINPDYADYAESSYSRCTIMIPITNLEGGFYSYKIEPDYGRDDINPFAYSVGYADGKDVIRLTAKTIGLTSLYGKTCSFKITPDIPGGNVGTAVLKVSILDPAKTQASISAKAKGRIDSVRDGTSVNITISYKNVHVSDSTDRYLRCINITKKENGTEKSYTNYFRTTTSYHVDSICISRNANYGAEIAAGTYKAYMSALILNSTTGGYSYLNTTVTFKVVRGKTQTAVNPSTIKLINRDYVRSANIVIAPKAAGVNAIDRVYITGAYAGNITLISKDSGFYTLQFREGYVEKSKIKQLWYAITKYVTKSVTMSVYYKGSPTPDKVTLKVKITP